MPRKPRFQLPGIPQHIVQRGNNREPCFYATVDYHRYLDDLGNALKANHCDLHAYVLMTNHVHLLITPQTEHGLSHTMQDTGRKYVRYINTAYRRTGTLWEGRYKASLVDSDIQEIRELHCAEWLDPYRRFAALEYTRSQRATALNLKRLGAEVVLSGPRDLDSRIMQRYRHLRQRRRV